MDNTRETVLDMLMEILEKGAYSHLVIRNVLDKYNYSDRKEKAFVKRVTEGTLERLIQIDYCLNHFSSVPVPKMKPLIRNLMRMSTYQLLFMDKVPDSAVCNEAVKLAGKRGFRGLSGFVNGVLRSLARNKEKLPCPEKEKDETAYLSVKYSMPEFFIRLWMDAYGREKTLIILEELLKEAPLSVRLRGDIGDGKRKEWLSALAKRQVAARRHPYLSCAYELENVENVRGLPGYEEGLFLVQDVSSMLAVEAAGIACCEDRQAAEAAGIAGYEDRQAAEAAGTAGCGSVPADTATEAGADEKILAVDVCAAPGGKSMYLAEKLGTKGKVISRDISGIKVSLLRDNIERMGYTNIEVQEYDACLADEDLVEKADVVLADLPCSGLGVIRKKKDIKYRIGREAIKELEELQKKILSVVWQYVKPGGTLVYSTCTMNPGENEKMAEWFTESYPFETESLAPCLPEELKEEGKKGTLQFFPGIHGTDGFFVARLRRKKECETCGT